MPRDQSGAGLAGVSTAPVVAEAEEGGRNAERVRRRDESASDSVMLFMRGGGVSVEEAPVSRCKVPLQEIIHGGFGLKGVKVFVCLTSHSNSQ